MSIHHIIVKMQCRNGHEKEVTDMLKIDACESRKVAGCQRFDIIKDSKDERTYHIFQVYNDKAAADAHMQSAHFKAVWALKEAGKFNVITLDRSIAFDI